MLATPLSAQVKVVKQASLVHCREMYNKKSRHFFVDFPQLCPHLVSLRPSEHVILTVLPSPTVEPSMSIRWPLSSSTMARLGPEGGGPEGRVHQKVRHAA